LPRLGAGLTSAQSGELAARAGKRTAGAARSGALVPRSPGDTSADQGKHPGCGCTSVIGAASGPVSSGEPAAGLARDTLAGLEVQRHHLAAEGIHPMAIHREHDAAGITYLHGNPVSEDRRARRPGGDVSPPFKSAVRRVLYTPTSLNDSGAVEVGY